MEDRLTEVLELIETSSAFDPDEVKLIDSIIELSNEIGAMDYRQYKDTMEDDNEFLDLIQRTMDRDVSDIVDEGWA